MDTCLLDLEQPTAAVITTCEQNKTSFPYNVQLPGSLSDIKYEWHGKVPKEYVIRFSCRGMLDLVEDCGFDVKMH